MGNWHLIVERTMLCEIDEDLVSQITQTSNRIRGLLTQIDPALKRVVGPHLNHHAKLDLLENQALIALARRRCGVLFAMLRDATFYSPPRPEISLTTT